MGFRIEQQFNRPVVGQMDEQDANTQILQVKLRSDGIKQIEALHCSYISQVNIGGVAADAQTAIANTFVQGRVIVVAEEIELTGLTTANLLDFHPFQRVIFADTLRPSNILFDKSFINELDIDFTLNALEIPDGIGCSILMGVGYTPIDTLGAISVKIGSLNVNGQYASEINSKFYNIPR